MFQSVLQATAQNARQADWVRNASEKKLPTVKLSAQKKNIPEEEKKEFTQVSIGNKRTFSQAMPPVEFRPHPDMKKPTPTRDVIDISSIADDEIIIESKMAEANKRVKFEMPSSIEQIFDDEDNHIDDVSEKFVTTSEGYGPQMLQLVTYASDNCFPEPTPAQCSRIKDSDLPPFKECIDLKHPSVIQYYQEYRYLAAKLRQIEFVETAVN